MKKLLFVLIALSCWAYYASAHSAFVSFHQYDNEWSITHGDDVLFHGSGHVDFNNMPPFIKHVVDSLNTIQPGTNTRNKSNVRKQIANSSVVVGPFITTSWNQEAPYNSLMPTIDGVHVPAGCSTISTAQVINYYKYMLPWTTKYDQIYYGNGTLESKCISWYDPSEVMCPEPVYHINYSFTGWSENINPAKLCEAIAFAQHAMFTPEETFTYIDQQANAIMKNFGYKIQIVVTDVAMISEMLIAQLDIQRPVILNARDNNYIGHSFIVDGYNSEGEFHLNMGWGEAWNCWSIPELWVYNQEIYAIMLYPDYDDESLFLREDEPGTAIFHNLTTGETFKAEMTDTPGINGYTGLFLHNIYGFNTKLTAGEYEFCIEYSSGKQISCPTRAPLARELFSDYDYYTTELVKGTSKLQVPYDCRLIFYAQQARSLLEIILDYFALDSYYVGDVEISITNQDSTLNELIPTIFSEKAELDADGYGGYGKYQTQHIKNIPAGNYRISANIHSETLGEIKVGVGAGTFPCSGNDFVEMNILQYIESERSEWLWEGARARWSDESKPYIEPLMVALPEQETEGSYTLIMNLETGRRNVIEIFAKWMDPNQEENHPVETTKIFDGHNCYILHGDKYYTMQGQEVRLK